MLILQKDLDRFWSKVNRTNSCWLWTGATSTKGYGRFRFEGVLYSPHVISYKLHNIDHDPTKQVCHRCDVRLCVNPEHLFLGTRSENMKDCSSKGRLRFNKGSKHGQAKLSENDVITIRQRIENGDRLVDIKASYGISDGCLHEIRNRSTWKHI